MLNYFNEMKKLFENVWMTCLFVVILLPKSNEIGISLLLETVWLNECLPLKNMKQENVKRRMQN